MLQRCGIIVNMSEENGAVAVEVFGENLRLRRIQRGWSQSEVARRMQSSGWPKYSQVAVNRTEEGTRAVRLDEAVALADLLDVSLVEMTTPASSKSGLVLELRRQAKIVVEAAKKLNSAAQYYEESRREALTVIAVSRQRLQEERAVASIVKKMEKEMASLAELAELTAWQILEWVEDEEDAAEEGRFYRGEHQEAP